MCDHRHLRSPTPVGVVDHVGYLSENFGELVESEEYSDITFIVEGERVYAHKVIMAARAEYFRALLYGGMKESQPGTTEISLPDTPALAFSAMLRYIYTGRMNLVEIKEENLLDILGLAHRFGFVELESAMSDYLKAILNIRNVCSIYDLANMYSLSSLCQVCKEFMDRFAPDILRGEAFLTLSQSSVRDLLSRNSFCAQEIDIFRAIQKWVETNNNIDPTPILEKIRLPLMSMNELLNEVRPTSMVSPDTILDAIKVKTESRSMDLKYRGFLIPEENIATARYGASVLRGEQEAALLDGDSQNYDLDRGFSRHPIDDNNGQGIVVKLGQPYIINNIKLLLWDRDMRSYSYYVELSMDDQDYERVIDHTNYLCRSWQKLYFPERVARYIRVVGTHNTVNRVFHLVLLETSYTAKPFQLQRGLYVPTENVATIKNSACVIEGVSRSRNALINGNVRHYDWDSGYTCHQLGSGAIVIQLPQPVLIASMRLLLWDCDDRSYSFYIEVSTDQIKWHKVADKRHEACKSWQTITFEARPVTFIRIVGTHNTANEVFHCVHFECPADTSASCMSGLSGGATGGALLTSGPPNSPSLALPSSNARAGDPQGLPRPFDDAGALNPPMGAYAAGAPPPAPRPAPHPQLPAPSQGLRNAVQDLYAGPGFSPQDAPEADRMDGV